MKSYEQRFREKVDLEEKEELLLKMYFSGTYKKDKLEKLLANLEHNISNKNFMLVLAHYASANQWKYISDEIKSKALEVKKFNTMKNAGLQPGLVMYLKELAEENIHVMFIKGMAMKALYAKDIVRIMEDADVLVRQEDYRKSRNIACRFFSVESDSFHSAGLRKGLTNIDLHKSLLKNGRGNTQKLWDRATEIEYHNVKVWIPSVEDTLALLLYNEFENVFNEEKRVNRIKWLFDAGFLMKHVDWKTFKLLVENDYAEEKPAIAYMLTIAKKYFPEMVDKDVVKFLRKGNRIEKILQVYDKLEKYKARKRTLTPKDGMWEYLSNRFLYVYYDYQRLRYSGDVRNTENIVVYFIKRFGKSQMLKKMTPREICVDNMNLTSEDISFLRQIAGEEITTEKIQSFYDKIEFDKLENQQVCSLVELSKKNGYQGVPKELLPRVQGVVRYYTAQYMQLFQELNAFVKHCNERQINVMLVKSSAMKAYYAPKSIRYLSEIEIWVKQSDFSRVLSLIKSLGGFTFLTRTEDLVVRKNKAVFRITTGFFEEKTEGNQALWDGAIETELHGEKVWIPMPEIQFMTIIKGIYNITLNSGMRDKWLRWVIDVCCLIDSYKIDWTKMETLCKQAQMTDIMHTILSIFNEILPGKISEDVLARFKEIKS